LFPAFGPTGRRALIAAQNSLFWQRVRGVNADFWRGRFPDVRSKKLTMRITNSLLLGAAALIWVSAPSLAQNGLAPAVPPVPGQQTPAAQARAPVSAPAQMAQAD